MAKLKRKKPNDNPPWPPSDAKPGDIWGAYRLTRSGWWTLNMKIKPEREKEVAQPTAADMKTRTKLTRNNAEFSRLLTAASNATCVIGAWLRDRNPKRVPLIKAAVLTLDSRCEEARRWFKTNEKATFRFA